LFVTTRILNFLKGLPVESSVDLMDLLNQPWTDQRTQIGFRLIKNLLETGRLSFWTRKGLIENLKFNAVLFARVLAEAGEIACQNGQTISVRDLARAVTVRNFGSAKTRALSDSGSTALQESAP